MKRPAQETRALLRSCQPPGRTGQGRPLIHTHAHTHTGIPFVSPTTLHDRGGSESSLTHSLTHSLSLPPSPTATHGGRVLHVGHARGELAEVQLRRVRHREEEVARGPAGRGAQAFPAVFVGQQRAVVLASGRALVTGRRQRRQ